MLRYFEGFRVGEVHELGSYSVSAEEIVRFARRYDPQPQHLPAPDGTLYNLVASGWHVAGMYMRLYVNSVARNTAMDVSPGVEQLRWLRPVRAGNVLSGRMTVIGTSVSLSRPDYGILHQRGELSDETGSQVMRFTFYSLIRRRP
ncbi:MAG: MaoC/PaaZ C-terminal domain-containing protein [Pseudonocardiaceae bacterium]